MDYKNLRIQLEEVLAGKHDSRFLEVTSRLHCMSTPRVYAVLNAIVSSMQEGEVYVEVGTYQGGSLISALLGNTTRAIGVDCFSEFTGTNSYERTQGNLEAFGMGSRVELKNMSYQEFFKTLPDDFVIQTYNYDGEHNYEGQLAGMEAGWKHLRAGSIIIVDDYLYPEVHHAVNQFVANHLHEVKYLLAIDSLNDCDPIWWNGVCILRVL